MPGIAGVISRGVPIECEQIVKAMTQAMNVEPFYEVGWCFAPEMGVYCGWVAHEGSFAAQESKSIEANGVRVLVSGECLMERSMTRAAKKEGGSVGESGGSRLSCEYLAEGDEFIGRLNGLFSGLVVDRTRKRAVLFNDRYGLERIYYYEKNGATFL